MSRGRLLATLLVLLGMCRSSAADWASDEAYIKRLAAHLEELQRTAALFEQERRSLDIVKFRFAGLELPLADPAADPEKIVRELLAKSFPLVKVSMRRLPTHAPPYVEVWKWRCTLGGSAPEIRWATQLLLQKGLFLLPGPAEPVTLELDASQRRGVLTFIGHHIRLSDGPRARLPEMPAGPDVLAHRVDPLAQEIRRLRRQAAALRRRVQDILTFEARVESMRYVIEHLKALTEGSRDPFRAFTPLLDLELVRFERLVHRGGEVAIEAAVPSESARSAAERWLRKLSRRRPCYRLAAVHPLYDAPSSRQLPLPGADHADPGRGPICELQLSGARPLDLAAASGASVMLAAGPEETRVSGQVTAAPLRLGLEAAARGAGVTLLRDRDALLALPVARADEARRCLEGARPAGGQQVALRRARITIAEALALLGRAGRRPVSAPREVLAPRASLALLGRAPVRRWLRLVGASLGLALTAGARWELRPAGEATPKSLAPVPPARAAPAPSSAATPLALLRPRLLLSCAGRPRAIVAADGGLPLRISVGAELGRGRGRVLRVDRRGVTVRWSDGGVLASVLLPFGELRGAPAPSPSTPPARRR